MLVGSMLGSVRGGCGRGLRGRVPRVHACQLAVSSPTERGAGKVKRAKERDACTHTRAVRHDALQQLLVAQARDGVERSARLERAHFLVVLAFEEEPHLRLCRFLPFIFGSF